jgi:hypothetical protein
VCVCAETAAIHSPEKSNDNEMEECRGRAE